MSEFILVEAGKFQVRELLFNVSGFWTMHFFFLSSLKELCAKFYVYNI